MDLPPLTTVLLIFLGGFILHRHVSVKIAAVVCLVLGVLLASTVFGALVHNLDQVISAIT